MLKILKRFHKFLLSYKKQFFSFLFLMILTTILQNLSPYIYKLLVDAIPSQNYQLLINIILLFVGLKLLTNFLENLAYYIGDKVLIPASRDARVLIFRRVQDLDFTFHVNKSTGALISAFKRGDGAFFTFFDNLYHDIIVIIVGLFVVLFFFSKITPLISILMILIFIINGIISWRLVKINIQRRTAFNLAEDKISGIITDNLINYETVKFFAQEQREETRLEQEFEDWSVKIWEYFNSFRLMDLTIGTLSTLGVLLIFQIIIQKLINGEITTGDMIMVATFLTGFYYQFFHLLYKLRNIAKCYVDLENYFSILDNEILIKDPESPIKVKGIKGEIKFKNINFKYPESKKNVLNNINLHIKPNESVAFVGRSGVGKTTLIKLLLRFYDADKGAVLIDGIDIKNFTKSQLRSFIGIVPQEPILFNNTIEFNIGYGNEKAKRKDIVRVSKMANLHDFIESLPKKYKTQVGERGIKLSGGQKQRLAIARMILSNPEIIIFDEATSQLDSNSEKLIQNSLWKISKNKTLLIIAHRFSTVRRAKRIVVMEKGKIAETGSHEQLIKKKGLYYYFWRLQVLQSEKERDPNLLR